jgi:hypothetical protein
VAILDYYSTDLIDIELNMYDHWVILRSRVHLRLGQSRMLKNRWWVAVSVGGILSLCSFDLLSSWEILFQICLDRYLPLLMQSYPRYRTSSQIIEPC